MDKFQSQLEMEPIIRSMKYWKLEAVPILIRLRPYLHRIRRLIEKFHQSDQEMRDNQVFVKRLLIFWNLKFDKLYN
jgi:hypothetical protein